MHEEVLRNATGGVVDQEKLPLLIEQNYIKSCRAGAGAQ